MSTEADVELKKKKKKKLLSDSIKKAPVLKSKKKPKAEKSNVDSPSLSAANGTVKPKKEKKKKLKKPKEAEDNADIDWNALAKGAEESLKQLMAAFGGDGEDESYDNEPDDEFFERAQREFEEEFGLESDEAEEVEEKKTKKKKAAKKAVENIETGEILEAPGAEPKKKKKKSIKKLGKDSSGDAHEEPEGPPKRTEKRKTSADPTEDTLSAQISSDHEAAQRKARQDKRAKVAAEMEEISEMDGTLDDVKRMVNGLVREGRITYQEAATVIKKWKAREHRRVGRQLDKATRAACFHCREPGHTLAECPQRNESNQGTGICFKCGSTEHRVQRCPRARQIKGFPHASCFVCGETGHLSKDCEQNKRGVYPDGGSCNLCGSTMHLKKDCPMLSRKRHGGQEERQHFASKWRPGRSADEEDEIPVGAEGQPKKKKAKVVKF